MDPTTANERIPSLDIVRGFALIGVFLVNWQSLIGWTDLEGTVSGATAWLLETLVVGKFYRLFAFLFGVGFVLHMRRCKARGAPFVPIYLRRLAVLLGIGLAHGLLLWPNDILALFAQLGVLLLLVQRVPTKWLVLVGVLCLFAAPLRYYVETDFADFRAAGAAVEVEQPAAVVATAADGPEALDVEWVRSEGRYRHLVVWTSRYFIAWQTDLAARLQMLREEFLMFLLGLWAGRAGLVAREADRVGWTRRVFLSAFIVGVGAHLMAVWLDSYAEHAVHGHLAITFRQIARAIRPAAFSLAYGVGAFHLVERFALQRLLAPVGAVGRMALTNYLLLSVLVTLTFYSFGLGLYGDVTVVGGVAMATASYALAAWASSRWLKRYRFGPAEWLWRSLTYGSWQPLRERLSPDHTGFRIRPHRGGDEG